MDDEAECLGFEKKLYRHFFSLAKVVIFQDGRQDGRHFENIPLMYIKQYCYLTFCNIKTNLIGYC